MADNIVTVKPGVRFLNNVGNFTVLDNVTGVVAFTGIYSTSYAIDISMSSQDTRAGRGNALIFRASTERTVSITLTVQDWNLEYIAASVGSKIDRAKSSRAAGEKSGTGAIAPMPPVFGPCPPSKRLL